MVLTLVVTFLTECCCELRHGISAPSLLDNPKKLIFSFFGISNQQNKIMRKLHVLISIVYLLRELFVESS